MRTRYGNRCDFGVEDAERAAKMLGGAEGTRAQFQRLDEAVHATQKAARFYDGRRRNEKAQKNKPESDKDLKTDHPNAALFRSRINL